MAARAPDEDAEAVEFVGDWPSMTWSTASWAWFIPVLVLHFAEREIGGDAMAFGILRDFIGNRHL